MTPPVYWVTEERPTLDGGGGALRQAGLLAALTAEHEVHLLSTGGPPDPELERALATVEVLPGRRAPSPLDKARWSALGLLGRSTPELASGRSVRRRFAERLARAPAGSIVVLNHPALVPLVTLRRDLRVVLELQYAPAAQLQQEASWSSGIRRMRLNRYAAATRAVEGRLYPRAQSVVLPSEPDAAAVRRAAPDAHLLVVPNAIDPGRYTPTARSAVPLVVLPASLDFPPNVDGAIWMATDVWPRVRAEAPGARLAIVGRSPGPTVRALADQPGVEVHPDVPDMHEWFDRARVIVVPLRFGTGTRLKALEAMALRRPLIGTTIGLGGLGIEPGVHAFVADEPVAFAAGVVRALTDDVDTMIDAAARRLHDEFTWEHVGRRFVDGITRP